MNHVVFMKQALALAQKGTPAPNPHVGAVVVSRGKIVGQGYHEKRGGPHAEMLALGEAGSLAQGSTLYTTLEPCCHDDPMKVNAPCTKAIVNFGVKQVVVASEDPNPRVSGKGISFLRDKGIRVITGIQSQEERYINRKYHHFSGCGLPYVHLKMAQTMDGYIAPIGKGGVKISCEESHRRVHQLRGKYQAVMVGKNTLLMDNPQLTQRGDSGLNPIGILLDPTLELPINLRVFESKTSERWIFYNRNYSNQKKLSELSNLGVKTFPINADPGSLLDLHELLQILGDLNISTLLVEGGGKLAGCLLEDHLVQEITWFVAPFFWGQGQPCITAQGIIPKGFQRFEIQNCLSSGSDVEINGIFRGTLCSQG
ncbi:MAG: bifunctional diaminohydroxyphosphoribosylaminopyrimidine deaminase/5-amino-6-(5-phosphoribosylamino)uracil reductase RibD [Spirochaetaceae bacterium]|nr:bifunctional diaminohydroxyphosphoribosylaminopyrimidine deaminase/5-amino-6-(5-phosphoribosylamino)uracil reductase RibD [Spirochaetaceae bacterium]